MIDIAHCIVGLEVGGAEMMLYRTVTRMDKTRFSARVITLTSPGAIGERLARENIPVGALGKRPGSTDLRLAWRIYRLLQKNPPSLIQSYLYEANVHGLIAARLLGIPVVWWIRSADMDYRYYGAWSAVSFRFNCWLSRFPDAILFNSQAGCDYHRARGFSNARMFILPNGFDTQCFRPDPAARETVRAELNLPPDAILIGRFARWDAMKDYPTLIAAAARVLREHRDIYFLCAGRDVTPDNAAFVRLVEEHQVVDRVILLGDRDDVPRWMAAVDFTVSSSMTEGFPNVVGEAMACGAPCIVTDVGDSAQMLDDPRWVVPRKDPAALAEAIERMLLLSPDERRVIGARARQRIVEQYDIARTTRRLEGFYEQLLSERSSTDGAN